LIDRASWFALPLKLTADVFDESLPGGGNRPLKSEGN